MKTLLLIDGNAIMHRAYHALPPLRSREGLPTNAIYGFFGMLHRAVLDFKPHYIAVCFDTPAQTFRQKLLVEYQAQRPQADAEFITQIPYIRDILEASGIHRVEKDGFEADDMIGTLTTKFKHKVDKVLILTGDKDIMQLVDKNVFVIAPQTGLSSITIYDEAAVEKKLSVKPGQIPDYKAFAGDPSDNYKGVKGIGPKTAVKLIEEFGSVENLIKHLSSIKDEKLRTKLEEHKDSLLLTKKIATIVKDVEVGEKLETYAFNGFQNEMKLMFEKLQLNSMLKRFFGTELPPPKKEPVKKETDPKEPQPTLF